MLWDIMMWLVLALCVGAVAVVGALFLRGYLTGTSPTASIFGQRPEKRMEVVDHANIDGRRRLVLVRRDDVEHLIMTGGPVDVVIETGISQGRARRHVNGEAAEPVFSRSSRTFGQSSSSAGTSAPSTATTATSSSSEN